MYHRPGADTQTLTFDVVDHMPVVAVGHQGSVDLQHTTGISSAGPTTPGSTNSMRWGIYTGSIHYTGSTNSMIWGIYRQYTLYRQHKQHEMRDIQAVYTIQAAQTPWDEGYTGSIHYTGSTNSMIWGVYRQYSTCSTNTMRWESVDWAVHCKWFQELHGFSWAWVIISKIIRTTEHCKKMGEKGTIVASW